MEKALEDQKQQHGLARVEPDSTSRNSPSGSSAFTSTDVISSSMSPSPNSRSFELRSVSQHEEDDKRDDRGALTPPLILLGSEVYATLTALAQLSFGHHGEFVGRGNLICALHSVSSAKSLFRSSNNNLSLRTDHIRSGPILVCDIHQRHLRLPRPNAWPFVHYPCRKRRTNPVIAA